MFDLKGKVALLMTGVAISSGVVISIKHYANNRYQQGKIDAANQIKEEMVRVKERFEEKRKNRQKNFEHMVYDSKSDIEVLEEGA